MSEQTTRELTIAEIIARRPDPERAALIARKGHLLRGGYYLFEDGSFLAPAPTEPDLCPDCAEVTR